MRKDSQSIARLKPKTSLSIKLTAYFVLFGVIIGYSVFIFSTAYNGRNLLQKFSDTALKEFDIADFELNDFNEMLFSENLQRIAHTIDLENLPLQEFNAYLNTEGEWKKYSFIGQEIRSKFFNIESEDIVLRALEKDIAFSSNPFIGKSDITRIYFSIPVPGKYDLVVAATLPRNGITDFVKDQKDELMGFLAILVAFSFILGKIFASSVTRPLRKLTRKALMIAEGDRTVNLFIRRQDEIGVLSRTLSQMNYDLNERLKAMEIMNKIDKAVLSSISRNDLLNRVVGFVCDYIDKSTAVMALRDNKGGGFELISAVRQSEAAIMIDTPYIPDELLSHNTLEDFQSPCVFSHDTNLTEVLIKQLSLPKNTKRFYNVPLYMREIYLGSLLVIKKDQQAFTDEQQNTLRKLGDQVGVAMQSVMAVEEVNSLQIGSIQALSRSIDAKSKWTAGHSERVAELSELLGRAVGMEEMQLRRLVISALLHDIGKIGIAETILDKPGKLTDNEFATIKKHPELGYEISRNIPNYEDICDGILYHHERWNGTGYPRGLEKLEIPQFGRIIAIADVFDALSADRPYRKGMSFAECIQFIEDRKAEDFDRELAEIFIETMKSSNNYLNNFTGGFKL